MASARQLRSTLVRSPVMLRKQVRFADSDNANTVALATFFFGQEAISGTLAVTEGNDAVAFVGAVLSAISGALAVTEVNDTVAFVGTVGVQASMSAAVAVARVTRRVASRASRAGARAARGLY